MQLHQLSRVNVNVVLLLGATDYNTALLQHYTRRELTTHNAGSYTVQVSATAHSQLLNRVYGTTYLYVILNLKGNSTLKNVGLNEYLREIKFCTGQKSVDVVQRKKIFNDKNHYLFTLKIVIVG